MHYDIRGQFSPTNQSKSYSFGVSRDCMKKLHLQEIENKAKEELPGPG